MNGKYEYEFENFKIRGETHRHYITSCKHQPRTVGDYSCRACAYFCGQNSEFVLCAKEMKFAKKKEFGI